MFGLSWFFGALTVVDAHQAFQWLFVIFNSLQGFFLFIFFCVVGKDARAEWLNVLRCGRKKAMKSSTGSNSHSRGTFKKPRSTDETNLTSHHRSHTLMHGAGLAHDMESSMAKVKPGLELTSFSDPGIVVSEAGETELIFANGAVHEEGTDSGPEVKLVTKNGSVKSPRDVEVPPHVLARLRGPYYQLQENKENLLQAEPHKYQETAPTSEPGDSQLQLQPTKSEDATPTPEKVELQIEPMPMMSQEEEATKDDIPLLKPDQETAPTSGPGDSQLQLQPTKSEDATTTPEKVQLQIEPITQEEEATKDDIPLLKPDIAEKVDPDQSSSDSNDGESESFQIESEVNRDLDLTELIMTELSGFGYEPSAESDDEGTQLW